MVVVVVLRQLSVSLHGRDKKGKEERKKNTPCDLLLPSCTGWNNDCEATAGNSKWALFKQVSSITRKRSSDADSSPFSPAAAPAAPFAPRLPLCASHTRVARQSGKRFRYF